MARIYPQSPLALPSIVQQPRPSRSDARIPRPSCHLHKMSWPSRSSSPDPLDLIDNEPPVEVDADITPRPAVKREQSGRRTAPRRPSPRRPSPRRGSPSKSELIKSSSKVLPPSFLSSSQGFPGRKSLPSTKAKRRVVQSESEDEEDEGYELERKSKGEERRLRAAQESINSEDSADEVPKRATVVKRDISKEDERNPFVRESKRRRIISDDSKLDEEDDHPVPYNINPAATLGPTHAAEAIPVDVLQDLASLPRHFDSENSSVPVRDMMGPPGAADVLNDTEVREDGGRIMDGLTGGLADADEGAEHIQGPAGEEGREEDPEGDLDVGPRQLLDPTAIDEPVRHSPEHGNEDSKKLEAEKASNLTGQEDVIDLGHETAGPDNEEKQVEAMDVDGEGYEESLERRKDEEGKGFQDGGQGRDNLQDSGDQELPNVPVNHTDGQAGEPLKDETELSEESSVEERTGADEEPLVVVPEPEAAKADEGRPVPPLNDNSQREDIEDQTEGNSTNVRGELEETKGASPAGLSGAANTDEAATKSVDFVKSHWNVEDGAEVKLESSSGPLPVPAEPVEEGEPELDQDVDVETDSWTHAQSPIPGLSSAHSPKKTASPRPPPSDAVASQAASYDLASLGASWGLSRSQLKQLASMESTSNVTAKSKTVSDAAKKVVGQGQKVDKGDAGKATAAPAKKSAAAGKKGKSKVDDLKSSEKARSSSLSVSRLAFLPSAFPLYHMASS